MKKVLIPIWAIVLLSFFLMTACSKKKSNPAGPAAPTNTPSVFTGENTATLTKTPTHTSIVTSTPTATATAILTSTPTATSSPTATSTPVPGSIWQLQIGGIYPPAREGQTTIQFNNMMWVIAGGTLAGGFNDVWYAPDTNYWNEASSGTAFTPRKLHSSVVFNNEMWVLGGYSGNL